MVTNQKTDFLCVVGYVHMLCLTKLLSRICWSIRRHFKRFVDTLIIQCK